MANGFLIRPLPFTSVTASSTAAGYTATNLGSDRLELVWRSANGAATRNIIFDLGADTPVDTITLHGLTGALQSWQWDIDLATSAQGAFTGSFWNGASETLLAGTQTPVSGKGRALWVAPAGAPASARYVRITFTSLVTTAVEVARVVIGSRIQLAGNFAQGAAVGIRPLGTLDFSSRGVILRRRGKNLRGIGVSFQAATRDEVLGKIMPFLELVGNTEGVTIVVDPDASADRQQNIYFGFLTGDLGSIWAGFNRFTASFNLVAVD